MREALSRVVKTISIKKRLSIIRNVHEAIMRVNDEEDRISFKKLAKILNLCHIFIPLINVKPNNSSDISLNIKDLYEMSRSKDKYKKFIELQAESLEMMVEAFGMPVTLNNLFLLLTRYLIDKNHYFINPLESSCILTEVYN